MCTASPCDLEEIPLDDEDSDSLEFKILEFYVKHHVFQNTSAVLSPKHLRTRSLSQKGPERWPVNEAWTQGPWPCVNSQSSEKAINLTKKKSSWRTLFGVAEKEEDSQSSPPEICPQVQRLGVPQARPRSPKWPRSRSSVDQRLEHKAADPRVVSIANRVAEIVYSWPPPEELHSQGGGFKSKGVPVLQGLQGQSGAESTKKEEDQIIARIVELLKYSGEQLERELKKDKVLMTCFQDALSYTVVKTITDQFLRGVDTRGESEVKAQSFKAALAIDVIAKLTTIDNHPMNRVLGFGTKYLKENFSPWIQQHGGWEKILRMPHEEVD
ncbi:apoptosis facilitator Bcl-2-like protein 14 isoform X4 [Bubalus kerabau]|uniref:apoptosis facilitator Bcl-2-like protein 14 isoform X3 n=1 Tax=Bubalus bubalis TaxID=89462 RepID=UPI000DBC7D56|nr:apoptosis facilitator Bcl-2-like protein 14 isoform X3 [Bubalus bubalis]XP_055426381.1 apoptosis facilitator Bcl-2-like protein 14 isoform X4 [Bubalus carabanensis]